MSEEAIREVIPMAQVEAMIHRLTTEPEDLIDPVVNRMVDAAAMLRKLAVSAAEADRTSRRVCVAPYVCPNAEPVVPVAEVEAMAVELEECKYKGHTPSTTLDEAAAMLRKLDTEIMWLREQLRVAKALT